MRDMTLEEKAKAYDEALEQTKKELNTCGSMDCDAARLIFRLFPELRESKDERIVRCIEMALTDVDEQRFKDFGITLKDCLTYLEKQKEQKPAEWSGEDEEMCNNICDALGDCGYTIKEVNWLKSLPQRFSLSSWGEEIRDGFFGKFNHNPWKPSEEQMDALLNAENILRTTYYPENAKVLAEIYNQLKKLM